MTDIDKERAAFEAAMSAARFFPAEINFKRTKSPSGRDEYANSHLQSNWEGWQARASTPPPAAEPPVGYFELPVRSGSVYREVDPKYKGDPDVVPLYRAAPAVQAVGEPDIVQQSKDLWMEAVSQTAFYVLNHCKDGEYHAEAVANMPMPNIYATPAIQPPPSAEPAPNSQYAGHCEGGKRCVCGGDTPGVRAGCSNWRLGRPTNGGEG